MMEVSPLRVASAALPSLKGQGGAVVVQQDAASGEAQAVQVVQEQLRGLAAQADELDAQATRLMAEASGDAGTEALHAKAEAQSIRGVVAEVRGEMNTVKSPQDKSRGVKLSATKLGEAMHHAAHEKAVVATAIDKAEAHHTAEIAKKLESATAHPSAVGHRVVRALPAAVVTLPAGGGAHPHGRIWGMVDKVQSFAAVQGEKIAHHPWVVGTRETALEMLVEAKEFADDPKAYAKKAARAAKETLVHGKDAVVLFVEEKTPELVKRHWASASEKIAATQARAAEKWAHAKAKAAEKLSAARSFLGRISLFGGSHSDAEQEKNAAPEAEDASMAEVRRQAVACRLPAGLACEAVPDLHSFSLQDLPLGTTIFSEVVA